MDKSFTNFKKHDDEKFTKGELIIIKILSILCAIVVFFAAVVVIGKYVFFENYVYYTVSGCSMNPTINPDVFIGTHMVNGKMLDSQDTFQDAVICRKNVAPKRGEIFVLQLPDSSSEAGYKLIIKRAIALPGDMVTIRKYDGEYHVAIIEAGSSEVKVLEEDYVDHTRWTYSISAHSTGSIQYEGNFYNSYLSGSYGPTGRVETVGDTMFYRIDENEVFYLGDNRVDSSDSRDRSKRLGKLSDVRGVVKYIVKGDSLTDKDGASSRSKKVNGILSFVLPKFSEFFAWNG